MSLLQESDQFNYKTIDDCCYNNYKICLKKRKTEKVRIKVKASVVGKFTHSPTFEAASCSNCLCMHNSLH